LFPFAIAEMKVEIEDQYELNPGFELPTPGWPAIRKLFSERKLCGEQFHLAVMAGRTAGEVPWTLEMIREEKTTRLFLHQSHWFRR
jgi:hypothetical protein